MILLAASVFPAPDSPLKGKWQGCEVVPDYDTLVILVTLHIVKRGLCNGKNMRRHLQSTFAMGEGKNL